MTIKTSWIKRKKRYGESGCKNPKERIRKISENTKKTLAKPDVKLKMINNRRLRKEKYGYINSPETRKKLSEIMKKKWANGEVTERQRTHIREQGINTQFKKGHEVSEKTREAVRKSRAKQIFPIKDSSIEVKIQNFLKELEIEFYSHFYIKEIKFAYRCDIFVPSLNLVIECDGNYWHGNPKIFSDDQLSKRIIEQRKLDEIRTKELISKGYKVLRLWEDEIKNMNLNDFELEVI